MRLVRFGATTSVGKVVVAGVPASHTNGLPPAFLEKDQAQLLARRMALPLTSGRREGLSCASATAWSLTSPAIPASRRSRSLSCAGTMARTSL